VDVDGEEVSSTESEGCQRSGLVRLSQFFLFELEHEVLPRKVIKMRSKNQKEGKLKESKPSFDEA